MSGIQVFKMSSPGLFKCTKCQEYKCSKFRYFLRDAECQGTHAGSANGAAARRATANNWHCWHHHRQTQKETQDDILAKVCNLKRGPRKLGQRQRYAHFASSSRELQGASCCDSRIGWRTHACGVLQGCKIRIQIK